MVYFILYSCAHLHFSFLFQKISLFIGLGPVFHVYNTDSYLLRFIADLKGDEAIRALFGNFDFLPSSGLMQFIGGALCEILPHGCDVVIEMLCGPADNINEEKLQVYVSQTPAGTSTKNLIHYGQGVRKNQFSMFDYGCNILECKNKEVYGSINPPAYNISAFDIPTALFYGADDWLADPKDVEWIIQNAPNLIYAKEIPNFAHLDYT